MKKIAFFSIVFSFISIGIIYFQNNIQKNVLSEDVVSHVNIKGFSFKNPELIFEKETLKLTAPKSVDNSDELVIHEVKNQEQEPLIVLSQSNLKDIACIQLGPLNEDKLSLLRVPLQKAGLVDRMIIEAVPVNFSYELFLGPYSTRKEASQELLRLEKEGRSSLKIFESNKEIFIKVKEFYNLKEAENWARVFVNQHTLNKVRLSRVSNNDRDLIQLIFPEVDLKRAQTLLNLAKKKKIPIYHCQLK